MFPIVRWIAACLAFFRSCSERLPRPRAYLLPRISVDVADASRSDEPTKLRDHTLAEYERNNETVDSEEYQVLWTQVMEEGNYQSSSVYKKVAVLNLYWRGDSSDMDVKREVDELEKVFKESFKYTVVTEHLNSNTNTQLQLQYIVAQFVNKHDSEDALLIVYYGGHGKPGHIYGDLELKGRVAHSKSDKDTKPVIEDLDQETVRAWTRK